jgi:DNA-binding response OmpR family regulator
MTETTIAILLIEDNHLQAQVIEKLLGLSRQVKFEVELVSTLTDGLRLLANKPFDLILTDLYLPDSYGLDTLTRVQSQAQETPIVVLTNIDEEVVAIKSADLGAQDYLVKSRLTSPVLIRAARFAIARHQMVHDLRVNYESRISELKHKLSMRQ